MVSKKPEDPSDDLLKKVIEHLKHKEILYEALKRGDMEPAESPSEEMHARYLEAHAMLGRGEVEKALRAFAYLVTMQPKQAEYWMGLGAALHLAHEYESAIDAYERALVDNIENPYPYFYLAKCFFAIHERENALEALDLAISFAEGEDFAELKQEVLKARETLLNA